MIYLCFYCQSLNSKAAPSSWASFACYSANVQMLSFNIMQSVNTYLNESEYFQHSGTKQQWSTSSCCLVSICYKNGTTRKTESIQSSIRPTYNRTRYLTKQIAACRHFLTVYSPILQKARESCMCSDIVFSNKRNSRQQTSQAPGVSEWMEE